VEVIGRQAFRIATENICGCVHFPSTDYTFGKGTSVLIDVLRTFPLSLPGVTLSLVMIVPNYYARPNNDGRGRAYRRGD